MRIIFATGRLHRNILLAILCLAIVSCAGRDPAYVRQLRESVPDNGSPATIKTNGPLGRPILRISVHENVVAVVTEGPVKDQYIIWTTPDLQTWGWRAFTPVIPSALLPLDRLYWFAKGRLEFLEGQNPPQGLPFPYETKLSDLIPNEDGLLAVAGTSSIYGMSEEGHWSKVATVPEAAQLKSLTKTAQGWCAIAPNTNHVWFWDDLKSSPAAATAVPAASAGLTQVVSTNEHTYLLTDKGVLEGDTRCSNWREFTSPANAGKLYSIAAGQRDIFLATQSGLFVFERNSWHRSSTSISLAATRRLRAIDGILYACHSGGLAESRNLGRSWIPSAEPVGIGAPVGDVIKYRHQFFAVSERGVYTRPAATDKWASVSLPAAGPTLLRVIASADDKYLVVGGEGAPDRKYTILALESSTGRWVPATAGLEEVHQMQRLETIRGQVYATTDVGLFRLDSNEMKWVGDRFNSQFGLVSAVATFKKRGLIVATGTHEVWYTEDALAPTHSWQRLVDTSFMRGTTAPLNDIWSNAEGSDVFITSWGQLLYFRDGRLGFANRQEYGEGYSFASIESNGKEYLFVGSDFGVAYVDRRQIQLLSIARLQMFYQTHSSDFLFWPISVLLLFMGSYLVAVLCVLILLYLPIPRGLIGTSWLITQIAKSLTISPLLGRWILFIGYEDRMRKRLASAVPIEDAHKYALLANAPFPQVRGAHNPPLALQLARCLAVERFILVEHEVFEPFPEYFALACSDNNSDGTILSAIPVLIASSDWRDSLVASASNVLRNHYSVPLDATEMLIGQMEKGNLVFIIYGLDKLGEKLPSVLDDIQRMMDTESFTKCYAIGCCTLTSDPLLRSSPALCRVVATPEASPDEVP
jgi:hypothetical protein